MNSLFSYFTDPVLRAPTIGTMLMCCSASLVGVITFLRKKSLIGETLSHATYPGVILGAFLTGTLGLSESANFYLPVLIMGGAFLTALLGYFSLVFLESRLKVKSDSALCLILSLFLGIGVAFASRIQFLYPTYYRQSLNYLYGQAATMTDQHILIYGLLACLVIALVFLLKKEFQVTTFDQEFSSALGINVRLVNYTLTLLLILSVVVGIRSVGVILMSAMLIAPPTAARQYTERFSSMLWISGFIGLLSGFLGNFLSFELSEWSLRVHGEDSLIFPTGPMVVIVSTGIALFSLIFSPKRGVLFRYLRISRFRRDCILENILKTMWRHGPDIPISFASIRHYQKGHSLLLKRMMASLVSQGWVECQKKNYQLTKEGVQKAKHIVRLHRLWELFLAKDLGFSIEKVHRSAEEMEHILTPELEAALTAHLKDPKLDPHHQPIPREDV